MTIWLIALIIVYGGMLILLLLGIKKLPVVKAGKVTKLCHKDKRVFGSLPNEVNGVRLSTYEKMYVQGNSMNKYNIHDGQVIYVRPFSEEEKSAISTYPVLVFTIINKQHSDDADYKLRKFVGYITNDNWEEVYNTYKQRIHVSKDIFIEQCSKKYSTGKFVLSETEDNGKILYSLHPVETVYGKVEYVV